MKLLWIILMAFIAYRLIYSRERRHILPPSGGYGDLPLPGPWGRREERRQAEVEPRAAAGGEEAAGESDDGPLRGPWDRSREEAPAPPREEADREVRYQGAGAGSETSSGEDPPREDSPGAFPGPSPLDTQEVARDTSGTDKNDTERCLGTGRGLPLQGLFTPRGIYQGFIMAEVLGSRGGRGRRRR